MKKFIKSVYENPYFILSVVLLSVLGTATLLIGGVIYSAAAFHCKAYANGKDLEWETTFPAQCWVVVDGKKYTKREYQAVFLGMKVLREE